MPIDKLNEKLLAEDNRVSQLAQLQTLQLNYDKTLMLLRALKAEEVLLNEFQMTDTGWTLLRLPEPLEFRHDEPVDSLVAHEPHDSGETSGDDHVESSVSDLNR